MKALSLWQPWATAIAVGVKHVETRHWSTHHRGPLAIHAARRWQADQREFASVEHALGRLPSRLPFGAIVAICRLAEVRPTDELEYEVSAVERLYGNFASGRFGWVLTDIKPLAEPIPFVGHQGLFDVPDELLNALPPTPAVTPQGRLL